jgi:hypothetical protein
VVSDSIAAVDSSEIASTIAAFQKEQQSVEAANEVVAILSNNPRTRLL